MTLEMIVPEKTPLGNVTLEVTDDQLSNNVLCHQD
jgi:hypothetical protein